MDRSLFCQILNSEMEVATGCTEPAAIALCAAYARQKLEGEPNFVSVEASTNIIKNAMAAGLPGTSHTGIDVAAAIGAFCGRTDRPLQVIDSATEEEREKALRLIDAGCVSMARKDVGDKLYIEVELRSESGHQSKAKIASAHTNLIYLEKDGVILEDHPIGTRVTGVSADVIDEALSVESIFDFVETLDRSKDDLHMIENAIEVNKRIAVEGKNKKFNLFVGQNIARMKTQGLFADSVAISAMERTACGIDARMGGASVPVVTNSGSGNQGITATIPVLTAAEYFGVSEEKQFQAVTLSHLMCIYIHCRFGMLSALCGATVAGTAAACAVTYLMGGKVPEIKSTINNMMGTISGMLCDGAKADCALKVATCVNIGFISASLAMNGICVQSNEGIVEKDADQTVKNFVRLGNEGSETMDNIILDIMLHKHY